MTATRTHTPHAAAPHARADKIRTQSDIPFGVWLCEPHDREPISEPLGDAPGISHALIHRVISEFSNSGESIVLDGHDHPFLVAVAHSIPDRAITPTTPKMTTHGDTPRSAGADHLGQHEHALVTTMRPPQQPVDVDAYQHWADLLRPTGVLVVITTNPVGPGRFHNHLGAVITAAGAAGLTYLQHIVAVAAHVEGDRLLVPTLPDRLRCADGVALHVPVHHDLIALYRPAHEEDNR